MSAISRSLLIVVIGLAATMTLEIGSACADTAASEEQQGLAAFKAGRAPEALAHYRRAYELDRTPMRALQVAIASTYAQSLSLALPDLWEWFRVKRELARAAGDQDPSWQAIETMQLAYARTVARLEAQIVTETTSVERLNESVKALKDQLSVQDADLVRTRSQLDMLRGRLDATDRAAAHQ